MEDFIVLGFYFFIGLVWFIGRFIERRLESKRIRELERKYQERLEAGKRLPVYISLNGLASDRWQIRYNTAKLVGERKYAPAVELLIRLLEDEYWEVRLATVEALEKIGNPCALEPLIETVNDEDQRVSARALEALETLVDPGIFDHLTRTYKDILRSDNLLVSRLEAVEASGQKQDPGALEALTQALNDEHWAVRLKALETLENISAAFIVEPFIPALRDLNRVIRQKATNILVKRGKPAVKPIIQLLNDEDPAIRGRAVEVLDKLGWKPKTERERTSYWLAAQQWDTLVTIGAPALPSLLKFANAKERLVREHIAQTLRRICATVETVIFGESEFTEFSRQTTLSNFDVAELTVPMSTLKTVIIHIETYDFHLVERFMTYAVNYIGQDYLKKYIEVHIYGDPEKLHPNLRNSLMNLCKRTEIIYTQR